MFQSSVLTKSTILGIIVVDITILVGAVWGALFLRDFAVPVLDVFFNHIIAFVPIICVAVLAFFVSNLYEEDLFLLAHKTMYRLTLASIAVTLIAVVLFYTYPYAGVTPKRILFIFIVLMMIGIYSSRRVWTKTLHKKNSSPATLIATMPESDDLYTYVNKYTHIPIQFSDLVPLDTASRFFTRGAQVPAQYVVVNTRKSLGEELQYILYHFVMSGGKIIDEAKLYESVFHKVPLSDANYRSFFEPVSVSNKIFIVWKRTMDVCAGLLLSIIAVPLIVCAACAIKIQDGGSIFISQTRVGKFRKKITLYKLRTMTHSDSGKWMKDREKENDFSNTITPIGAFLRKMRIDELPQLWNIFRGDISLIGPRPDLESFVPQLEEAIPYYELRYAVQPGLSGWAQIHQHEQPQSIEETRERLAYDLYYVKYRSIMVDMYIGLKTIKTLLSREGK
jgi:lipopolysaccharide/colanic/teichoic acid biosynthesis glycosyltransferase